MIKGKFFHTFVWDEKAGGKRIQYQGMVRDYDSDKHLALVLLFSWTDGSPTHQYLKTPTEDWVFYETDLEMEEAWIDTLPFEKQDHVRKMSQFTRKMDKEDREREKASNRKIKERRKR